MDISKIIAAAAKSPLGIVALFFLLLSFLAFRFFRNASERTRIFIFILFLTSGIVCFSLAYNIASTTSNGSTDKDSVTVKTPDESIAVKQDVEPPPPPHKIRLANPTKSIHFSGGWQVDITMVNEASIGGDNSNHVWNKLYFTAPQITPVVGIPFPDKEDSRLCITTGRGRGKTTQCGFKLNGGDFRIVGLDVKNNETGNVDAYLSTISSFKESVDEGIHIYNATTGFLSIQIICSPL